MFAKVAASLAGLAIVGQAFLLPPSISSNDIEIIKTIPIEIESQAVNQPLNLQCTGCPLAVAKMGGSISWIDGVDSYLQLQFSITHDAEVLSLNGVQIYPLRLNQAPEPLTALQVAHGTDPSDPFNQHLRLGYELSLRPVGKSSKNGGLENVALVVVHFQIAEIGEKFVDGLESVELKIAKTTAGKLVIVTQAGTTLTSNPPMDPSKDGTDCSSMICKFKAIMAGKLSQMKSGKKGCGTKSHPSYAGRPLKNHGYSRPFRHGHRHGGHSLGRVLHILRRVALHILIPVMIGIAVGMTASIIGVIAGQMIVFFWRAIYRNGQGSYSHVEQEEENEEDADNETKSFLDNHDPPPVYDEFSKDEKTAR